MFGMALKVFEAFSGYGSQSIALENIGVEHEVVAISEIDKYAILSYDTLHKKDIEIEEKTQDEMLQYLFERNIGYNEKSKKCTIQKKEIKPLYEACIRSNNLGDISKIKVEDIPQHDLFTLSFPCQDCSVSGKGLGLAKGSGTRSSLLRECQKVIEGCKPKYLFMENVKNLLSKKFKPFFDERCNYLEELGYSNYYSVLNGKDFGVPQNRERVFMISILGEHKPYEFPTGFPLEIRLKDILEESVDEKYYLPQEMHDRFIQFPKNRLNNDDLEVIGTTAPNPYNKDGELIYDKCTSAWVYNPNKCISTLSARDYKQPKQILEPVRLGGLFDTEKSRHQAGSVWDKDNICPTLDTAQGGWRQPLIVELPCIAASRGRNPNNPSDRRAGIELEQRLEPNQQGICNTLTSITKDNYVVQSDFKIRRLTPKEYFRLMGLRDNQIEKIKEIGISDTQMYKMAGNSIIVGVLEAIFRNLFLEGEIYD